MLSLRWPSPLVALSILHAGCAEETAWSTTPCFVLLTQSSASAPPLLVDRASIVAMQGSESGTQLFTEDGASYLVEESPEEILEAPCE